MSAELVFKNYTTDFIGFAPLEKNYYEGRGIYLIPFRYIVLDVDQVDGRLQLVLLLFPIPASGRPKDIEPLLQEALRRIGSPLDRTSATVTRIERALEEFRQDLTAIDNLLHNKNVSLNLTFSQLVRSLLDYPVKAHFEVNGKYKIYPQVVAYSPAQTVRIWAKLLGVARARVVGGDGNYLKVQADLPSLDSLPDSPLLAPLKPFDNFSRMEQLPAPAAPSVRQRSAAKATTAYDTQVIVYKLGKSKPSAPAPAAPVPAAPPVAPPPPIRPHRFPAHPGKPKKQSKRPPRPSVIGGAPKDCKVQPLAIWAFRDQVATYPSYTHLVNHIENLSASNIPLDVFAEFNNFSIRKPTSAKVCFIFLDSSAEEKQKDYSDATTEYYFNMSIPTDSSLDACVALLSELLKLPNCYLIFNISLAIMIEKPHIGVKNFCINNKNKIVSGVWTSCNGRNVLFSDFPLEFLYVRNRPADSDIAMLNGALAPSICIHSLYFDSIPHDIGSHSDKYIENSLKKQFTMYAPAEYLHVRQLYLYQIYKKNIFASKGSKTRDLFYKNPDVSKLVTMYMQNISKRKKEKDDVFSDKEYKTIVNRYIDEYHDVMEEIAQRTAGDYVVDGPEHGLLLKLDAGGCKVESIADWGAIPQRDDAVALVGGLVQGENRELWMM